MAGVPSLATYESMAQAQYGGQQAAEQTQATATHQANLNTLNTELGSVGTQYDLQEEGLKSTVQQEAGQIAQTYATSLLGNTSGLQGNDMGEMFSKANLQQQSIESQRTNAINSINTSIANENIQYGANESAITSKYQSLEESAADSMYSSAVSAYNDAAYKNAELALSGERLAFDESKATANSQNSYLSGFKSTAKKSGGFAYTGPNGEAIDLGQYALAISGGNTDNALSIITSQLHSSTTSYDKQALNYIGQQQKAGKNSQDIMKGLESKYGIDFGGSL